MEAELSLPRSFNSRNAQNILFILIQEGVKGKAKEILSKIRSITDLEVLLKSGESIDAFYENIRSTPMENIKIGKSKVDGRDYFIDINKSEVIGEGFEEIVEIFEIDGKIIFQACNQYIDGYYAYYDYNSGEVVSSKSDRKMFNYSLN